MGLSVSKPTLKQSILAGSLLLVAVLQVADFGTDLAFAIEMRLRGHDMIFTASIISLSIAAFFRLLLNLAFATEVAEGFCGMIMYVVLLLLLSPLNMDGLLWAILAVWSHWGKLEDVVFFGSGPGPGEALLVGRIIEIVCESLPQGCIQIAVILLDIDASGGIELWMVVSVVASLAVIGLGMQTQATSMEANEILSASYFDRILLCCFCILDGFLRASTIAIALTSDWAMYACTWWAVSALSLLAFFFAQQGWSQRCFCSDADDHARRWLLRFVGFLGGPLILVYLLIISSSLAPTAVIGGEALELFTYMFFTEENVRRISCLSTSMRQLEMLALGIIGCATLDGRAAHLSISVVFVWPLAGISLLRLLAVKFSCDLCPPIAIDGKAIDVAIASLDAKRTEVVPFPGPAAQQIPPSKECMVPRSKKWNAKACELSERGFELGHLLDFYSRLGTPQLMPEFDSWKSTTNDVVREAIIPSSWDSFNDQRQDGKALAPILQGGALLARRLVSHTWTNIFTNTVAAMVADALDENTFEAILPRLAKENLSALMAELEEGGVLTRPYWFCALSVNQHDSICASFGPPPAEGTPEFQIFDQKRKNTVTKALYPLCGCPTEKHFNDAGALCEINKFDDMLRHMAEEWQHRGQDFKLIVAVDPAFELFKRIWCIAELVESRKLGIEIKLKLPDAKCLGNKKAITRLRAIRVQDCEASRAEDVQDVLHKIGDEAAMNQFNDFLQHLIFDEDNGILREFLKELREADTSLAQEVLNMVAAVARAAL